ncbi:MAG: hypothetical protein M1828_000792 [Chrysothrix sp. TS-e1954]|nr:MAG: hypothetical protein M1828_000792 [Chrysothrix sp. TS-e1954]
MHSGKDGLSYLLPTVYVPRRERRATTGNAADLAGEQSSRQLAPANGIDAPVEVLDRVDRAMEPLRNEPFGMTISLHTGDTDLTNGQSSAGSRQPRPRLRGKLFHSATGAAHHLSRMNPPSSFRKDSHALDGGKVSPGKSSSDSEYSSCSHYSKPSLVPPALAPKLKSNEKVLRPLASDANTEPIPKLGTRSALGIDTSVANHSGTNTDMPSQQKATRLTVVEKKHGLFNLRKAHSKGNLDTRDDPRELHFPSSPVVRRPEDTSIELRNLQRSPLERLQPRDAFVSRASPSPRVAPIPMLEPNAADWRNQASQAQKEPGMNQNPRPSYTVSNITKPQPWSLPRVAPDRFASRPPEASSGSRMSTHSRNLSKPYDISRPISPPLTHASLEADVVPLISPSFVPPPPPQPPRTPSPPAVSRTDQTNDYLAPPEFSAWPSASRNGRLSKIQQSPQTGTRNSEVSFSKRRSMVDEMRRLSFTPSEMLVHPPRVSSLPRTLGQSSFKQAAETPLHQVADIEGAPEPLTPRDALGNPITPPPDGGRQAWTMACSGFFVIFNTWGLTTAFGVFQSYYAIVKFTNLSLDRIAWIGSVQLFLLFFLGIPVGIALDRGYFRLAFNGGTAILLAGVYATAFCTEWWHFFLAQGVATGMGMGLMFCAGMVVLMQYFSKNIGLATAIAASGGPVGAIVYAVMFQQLILHHTFRTTCLIMAVIPTVTLILPTVVVRPRRGHPQQARTFSLAAYADIPYLTMTAGLFFAFWGLFFGFYYIVLYSIQILHTSGTDSITLLIAMCAANIPGRLFPGLISDRCIGPLNTIFPASILAGLMIFLWIGVTNTTGLYMIACSYGFFAAGVQSMYSATIYSFCYRDPTTLGQKTGLSLTIISFACLTGQPIGGRLIADGDGSFKPAQLFAGGCLVVGFVLLFLARILKVGFQPIRA